MSSLKDEIIGKGWSFPPTFDPINKEVKLVTGLEDIRQSLHVLFGTQPGERVLLLQYGCDLPALLFKNMSLTQKTMLENRISFAIRNFESRIILHKVAVDTSQQAEGVIFIQIDFTIDRTNNRQNMVFPFFIEEGTMLSDSW